MPSLNLRHNNLSKKLSQQQQSRIAANRHSKLQSGNLADAALVVAHMGYQIIAEQQGQLIACDWRKQLGDIAVNDRVLLSPNPDGSAVVEAIFPRERTLYKWQGRHSKAVASHLDQLLIAIACEPDWQSALIDRYLIAAQQANIAAAIICNKIDLASAEQLTTLEQRLAPYRLLNIPIFFISTKTGAGLAELNQHLLGKQNILCGQSGVGKSSLVRHFIPEADIWIQAISAATGLGKHTTTNVRRYAWQNEACLIDTPGVRGFAIKHLDKASILAAFPDISHFASQCKFNDCRHENEPHCAVQAALASGAIHAERYQSLQQLLHEQR